MLKNYPLIGNEKSHPSRRNLVPWISSGTLRRRSSNLNGQGNLPIEPRGYFTCRSLNRRDANASTSRRLSHLDVRPRRGRRGNQFWAISVRWDRPKLAGSFEGIKWDI